MMANDDDRARVLAVLQAHEDCMLNDRPFQDPAVQTGMDSWSCGIVVPFTDRLEDAEHTHIAAAIAAALPTPAPEECCHAARDGDCEWEGCPQLADGEPAKSGRHCPLDTPAPEAEAYLQGHVDAASKIAAECFRSWCNWRSHDSDKAATWQAAQTIAEATADRARKQIATALPTQVPEAARCNCATYGHARLCPVHTQEDFDTAEAHREAPAGEDATLTADGAHAAQVLHEMAVEDNPGHADWVDCATSGPCRDEGERFASLAQRGAADQATLAAVRALADEWEHGEYSATAVEPGIAYCAALLRDALDGTDAETALRPGVEEEHPGPRLASPPARQDQAPPL